MCLFVGQVVVGAVAWMVLLFNIWFGYLFWLIVLLLLLACVCGYCCVCWLGFAFGIVLFVLFKRLLVSCFWCCSCSLFMFCCCFINSVVGLYITGLRYCWVDVSLDLIGYLCLMCCFDVDCCGFDLLGC